MFVAMITDFSLLSLAPTLAGYSAGVSWALIGRAQGMSISTQPEASPTSSGRTAYSVLPHTWFGSGGVCAPFSAPTHAYKGVLSERHEEPPGVPDIVGYLLAQCSTGSHCVIPPVNTQDDSTHIVLVDCLSPARNLAAGLGVHRIDKGAG
jgi:hypothetical protein